MKTISNFFYLIIFASAGSIVADIYDSADAYNNPPIKIERIKKCTKHNVCFDFIRVSKGFRGTNDFDNLGEYLTTNESKITEDLKTQNPKKETFTSINALDPEFRLEKDISSKSLLQKLLFWRTTYKDDQVFIADIAVFDFINSNSTKRAIQATSNTLSQTSLELEKLMIEEVLLLSCYQRATNSTEKEELKKELAEIFRMNRINNQHPVLRVLNQSITYQEIIKVIEKAEPVKQTEKELLTALQKIAVLSENMRKQKNI